MDNKPVLFDPPGEMVNAGGADFHVQRFKSFPARPWIVFETGLTLMSFCWGWLAPLLKDSANLILYDRAGLGWSGEREGLRDSKQIATELNMLLQALEISQPVLLLGHSIGAMHNRAFAKLFPEKVKGFVWLDPSHPGQMTNRATRRRMRNFFLYLEAAHLLASKGMPKLEIALMHQIKGLPDAEFQVARQFFRNPRHLRTTAREARAWQLSADFSRDSNPEVPTLILSAQKNCLPGWNDFQKNLASSPRTIHVTYTDASHVSILTNKLHATRAAEEIRKFLGQIPDMK